MSAPLKVIDLGEALRASLAAAFYGPALPVAFCRSCDTRLTFERECRHSRMHGNQTVWRCVCEGCVDGEYTGDPLTLHTSVKSGEGDSPWEALDDIAATEWDCLPEELLQKEGT